MHKKLLFILPLLVTATLSVSAQNQTSSPYSGFGLGELNDNVPNTFRAMGGVGVGMRSNRVINPMQPASYTACDSLTFMFDVAATVSWSRYNDTQGKRNRANGNLDYLTMQFPIWKQHIAFSAGILPYASRGYNFTLSGSTSGSENAGYHYTTNYVGAGTISEVYGGLSFNILDWVALGCNVYYMFTRDYYSGRTLTFQEGGLQHVTENNYLTINSVRVRAGLQFFHTFGDHRIVLGGIFEPQMKLNNQYYTYETFSEWYAERDGETAFDMPYVAGGGLSYTWKNRLTLAADYTRQQWASCRFDDILGQYSNTDKIAFGVEYRNNPIGRSYADRMMWRAGFSTENNYITAILGRKYVATVGIGFPLRNSGTVFNISLQYTHNGDKELLEENALAFTFNAAIAENWFFKRKL